MITEDKLKVFEKYKGEADQFARAGKSKEKSFMKDKDWDEIESLLQDIYLVKKRMAAPEFENKLNGTLAEVCEDQQTIKKMHQLAESRIQY